MKLTLSFLLMVTCVEIINYFVAADGITFDVASVNDDVYVQLKRRKPTLRRPREERLRHKEDICVAIIGNEFFDMHKVEMVNPNHRSIFKQIKQHYPDIHDEHFKTEYSSEIIKPRFANPYKLRDVAVNGKTIREYMFSCVAKNYSTNNLGRYFISPEYVMDDMEQPKTVRFIFAHNEKKEMALVAEAQKGLARSETWTTVVRSATKNPTTATKAATTVKATEATTATTEESSQSKDSDESESW